VFQVRTKPTQTREPNLTRRRCVIGYEVMATSKGLKILSALSETASVV
jgi:hypothetical protein